MINERYKTYDQDHCWQYDIRLKNYDQDLRECGLTQEYTQSLRVGDFDFRNVTDKKEQKNLSAFIKRHEWLGNLSQFPTHWFACYHKEHLAGVIIFNVPNSFSKLLGDDTPKLERLISRGACISWSPKNLASALLMWSIKWMVDHTDYRLFTAYSDPSANELGTIYQACNFYYLGQSSGAVKRYVNPYTGKFVSDRFFRQKTSYKRYAMELGLPWTDEWKHKTGMNWHLIPDDIEQQLREHSRKKQKESIVITLPSKHKYAYILGRTKNETKWLRKHFLHLNKTYEYPKNRGQ